MAALQHNASHCQEERREFRCDYCSSVKSDATEMEVRKDNFG
jgi:hypothetical protein